MLDFESRIRFLIKERQSAYNSHDEPALAAIDREIHLWYRWMSHKRKLRKRKCK